LSIAFGINVLPLQFHIYPIWRLIRLRRRQQRLTLADRSVLRGNWRLADALHHAFGHAEYLIGIG